jgi:hypothetical protein
MWTCSTPPPIDRTPRTLAQLYDACSLDGFIDKQFFSLNTGSSIRAAQIYFWLSTQRHPQASRLAQLALAKRVLPPNTPLPVIRLKKNPPVTDIAALSIIPDHITETGLWGEYPYWHLRESNNNFIAISPEAPIRTLRYALASRSDKDSSLNILVLSDNLTTISLSPPSSSHAEHIEKDEHGWSSKTDLEYARLDMSDEEKSSTLFQFIAAYPNKTVELAMNHEPCTNIYPQTKCISGSQTKTTRYIDLEPIDNYSQCNSMGICSAQKGTWMAAVQQCRHRGKQLPTNDDRTLCTNEQWTSEIGVQSHHRLTTSNQSINKERILSSAIQCVVAHLPNIIPKREFDDIIEITEEKRKRVHQLVQQENLPRTTPKNKTWRYKTQNIALHHQASPYFKNQGGAYIGIADGFGFEHIAQSRPQWAFVFGNNIHFLRRYILLSMLIAEVDSPNGLQEIMNDDKAIEELLGKVDRKSNKLNQTDFIKLWKENSTEMKEYINHQKEHTDGEDGWMQNHGHFQFLKKLIENERFFVLSGRWAGKKTISSIAKTLSEINVPVRMLYLGEVEDGWRIPRPNRQTKNLSMLPFDDQSRVYSTNKHTFEIIDGRTFQERIAANHTAMWWDRIPSTIKDVLVTGKVPITAD